MFNEKTGDPLSDNAARNINRAIKRELRRTLRFRARNWKRRRVIQRIEGNAYAELLASVMLDLSKKEQK